MQKGKPEEKFSFDVSILGPRFKPWTPPADFNPRAVTVEFVRFDPKQIPVPADMTFGPKWSRANG